METLHTLKPQNRESKIIIKMLIKYHSHTFMIGFPSHDTIAAEAERVFEYDGVDIAPMNGGISSAAHLSALRPIRIVLFLIN
jgi:hypothetical protein